MHYGAGFSRVLVTDDAGADQGRDFGAHRLAAVDGGGCRRGRNGHRLARQGTRGPGRGLQVAAALRERSRARRTAGEPACRRGVLSAGDIAAPWMCVRPQPRRPRPLAPPLHRLRLPHPSHAVAAHGRAAADAACPERGGNGGPPGGAPGTPVSKPSKRRCVASTAAGSKRRPPICVSIAVRRPRG